MYKKRKTVIKLKKKRKGKSNNSNNSLMQWTTQEWLTKRSKLYYNVWSVTITVNTSQTRFRRYFAITEPPNVDLKLLALLKWKYYDNSEKHRTRKAKSFTIGQCICLRIDDRRSWPSGVRVPKKNPSVAKDLRAWRDSLITIMDYQPLSSTIMHRLIWALAAL